MKNKIYEDFNFVTKTEIKNKQWSIYMNPFQSILTYNTLNIRWEKAYKKTNKLSYCEN